MDDEPDTLEFLRVVLQKSGAEVVTATSVDDAFLELERFRPDLVVSDIGMPGRDGYDLIRTLRALPEERGGRLPAVALTAYARSEDETRTLSEGFQAHISKPFEPSELVRAADTLCRKNA